MTLGQSLEKCPDVLSLLPLKDIVIFPQMILPVFISEDICLRAVEAACSKDRSIFLSAFRSEHQREGEVCLEHRASTSPPFDVYDIGTIATVMRTRKLPDGRTKVLIQGNTRAIISGLKQSDPYPVVFLRSFIEKTDSDLSNSHSLIKSVKELLEKSVTFGRIISPDILMLLEDVSELSKFSDLVAGNLNIKISEAQKVLGTADVLDRMKYIHDILLQDIELGQKESHSQKKDDHTRVVKETYLREQIKNLKTELGDLDGKDEIEDFRDKIQNAKMSEEGRVESLKQLKRLERMNQDSSEATLTRTYIDWMIDLPWNRFCDLKIDMLQCKKILNEDHYGLDKIKDRILEYIAVKKLNPNAKGPILCFVGPPGVGKTSLGKSIARSLGRKFARISLGGVRDEAEIRGHRRTYVGSMPGRIIQSLKNVNSKNPVLMLDEIDKLGTDYKGDPASALLEVLDPEQNHTFSDHYISVPFDLSQVIFLANANRLDTIPHALRDRLEIIEVSGYSEEEKAEITRKYIIPKIIQQNGLLEEHIQFQDAAISLVINGYTRESGLRSLEKNVATITRKLARYVAENDDKGKSRKTIKITAKLTKELLGEERYFNDDIDLKSKRIGLSLGLAYTQSGGEILELEVKLLPGNGKVMLTGQLGEVMKESAHTAISCIRGFYKELNIDPKKFQEVDIHIHAPAGAIPKDGPSAGVALSMALISAFREEPLRQNIAMTGEITLHGKVLPIGGIREKMLAALRSGIQEVCLPEKNKGAIAELSLTLKRKLHIHFISSLKDAIVVCFEQNPFESEKAEIDIVEHPISIDNNISAAIAWDFDSYDE